MREYKVMASSMEATYSAGRFIAESAADACEQARIAYRNSPTGRALNGNNVTDLEGEE